MRPQRFIVVDDDMVNNTLCRLAIYKVFSDVDIRLFSKPEEALDFIQEEYGKPAGNTPTVLFLDINMPTMTGWRFLDLFKRFNDKIKNQFTIFMLSSSVDRRDKEKAESNPYVSGFLSKPLKKEELKGIIAASV